ncbi:MAG: polyribonucleotide nucleotidyltransferase [Campylobacterales bacterium]
MIFDCQLNAAGRPVEFRFGYVAKQADGSVWMKSGNTVMLATVVSERTMIEEGFVPLTVQYIEKAYAAGKFPGGFVKREAKPGEFEVLTSRLIDRSLRPLFPKGYNYETQIIVTVLSVDRDADLQVMALNAASAALYTSDVPARKAVTGVRVGRINGQFVLNPSLTELKESTLDLFVAGTKDEILMIEMMARQTEEIEVIPNVNIDPLYEAGAGMATMATVLSNEISEEELVEAIAFASKAIAAITTEMESQFAPACKQIRDVPLRSDEIDAKLLERMRELALDQIKEALNGLAKSERSTALNQIAQTIASSQEAEDQGWTLHEVKKYIELIKRDEVRRMILKERRRADGRGLQDVRPITIETNILPSAHGSCLFTRGQTQALAVATLGTDADKQQSELLTSDTPITESFTLHYNFPGYAVGEATRLGPPGRRELGHGNLAKRAIQPLLDPNYDHALRVVSEILESNGSSSMATVCAASLALKGAGVPLSALAAGVAMGLVSEGEEYAILTDIMGLEDHDGDMDFKVAGTRKGITAMQMDIKLGGLPLEILKEALLQARDARMQILDMMEEAESKIRVNEEVLPSIELFQVAAERIVDIIGQAGKTIKEIIERFEVAIDLNRETGMVKVVGRQRDKVSAAKEHILGIAESGSRRGGGRQFTPKPKLDQYEVGQEFEGRVKKVVDFGAFVELPGGFDGLLHVSKLGKGRINIHDHIKEGDIVHVKIVSIGENRIELAKVE